MADGWELALASGVFIEFSEILFIAGHTFLARACFLVCFSLQVKYWTI